MSDLDVCLDALLLDAVEGEDRIAAQNLISAHLHAWSKDTPARQWWEAQLWHPAVGRALRIDREQEGGVFALAPFRLMQIDGRHVVAAAWPAPRLLGPVDMDWLAIEHVIAWEPTTDKTEVLGDPVSQLVGSLAQDPVVFGDTREFFVCWAQARAEFFVRWCQSRKGEWSHGATETDLAPGALAIGPIDKIRWQPSVMPESIACVGMDPQALNRALLRSANIPRAFSQASRIAA